MQEKPQQIKNALIDSQIGNVQGNVHIGDTHITHISGENAKELPQRLVPLPTVGEFVGREKELQDIDALLAQNKPVLVVNGLGGIGKTTLALEYAHRYAAQYTHIIWLRQTDSLINTFAFEVALLQRLGVPFSKETPAIERAKGLLQTLSELEGTHLLVIDNFAHAELDKVGKFLQFFPFGTWRVLFTSRDVIPQFARIDLDVLPAAEALALFRLHIGDKQASDEEINTLLQYVGYHTLAVELLAKTYHKSLRLKSVGEMAALLKEQKIDASILQKEVHTPHAAAQVRIYEHLLRIFAISGLDEKECHVLKQFAVLPTLPLTGENFLVLIRDEEGDYEDSLLSLRDKGWLSYHEDACFAMHPLVQLLIRKQLKPCLPDCENLVISFIASIKDDSVQANPLAYRWTLGVGETLLQNIDFQDNLSAKGLLWNKLYWVYDALGEYQNALRCAEESLVLVKEVEGERGENYLASLNNLGGLHQKTGDYTKALPLYEECLQLRKEVLGERHPAYLASLNNLGNLHKATGAYAKALPLLEECLQLQKEVLGERHPAYLVSLNNLGNLHESMGAYAKALPLLEAFTALAKEVLGERHPHYLVSLNSLGSLHESMGAYAKALPLYEECLQLRKEVLGERHPAYLTSLNNLGMLHQSMDEYAKALPLYEECLHLTKEILGERHPHYLSSLNNLGILHKLTGEYAKALPLYKECLQLRKEVLGEHHPEYLASLHNLGTWHFEQGQYQEALPYFDNAHRGFSEVLGEAHPHTKIAKEYLYGAQIKLIEAELLPLLPEGEQERIKFLKENEEARALGFALMQLYQEFEAMKQPAPE